METLDYGLSVVLGIIAPFITQMFKKLTKLENPALSYVIVIAVAGLLTWGGGSLFNLEMTAQEIAQRGMTAALVAIGLKATHKTATNGK